MATRRPRYSGIVAAALITALVVIAGPAATRKSLRVAILPTAIAIHAEPIATFDHHDPSRRRFGLLEFRGGLVLTSKFREFGGLSSLRVDADGANFIAVSDRGWWLRGRIAYDGKRPTGISDVEMAPLLASDSRPITARRRWYDSEAIARDGGTLYVALERVHRILRYDYGRDGLRARGHLIGVPAAMRRLPDNKGIEALIFVPHGQRLGGTLIAISERGLPHQRNNIAFLIGGPLPGSFAVKRKNDFDISDAALLPTGDLLVLERKFGWSTGLYVRIRRIALASVRPGALVEGPTVFEADLGQQVDNMEGLSVHVSEGETVLTLISDDNFSTLQRTLLLQFTLAEP
jgi:hypothetical protein